MLRSNVKIHILLLYELNIEIKTLNATPVHEIIVFKSRKTAQISKWIDQRILSLFLALRWPLLLSRAVPYIIIIVVFDDYSLEIIFFFTMPNNS